MLYPAQSGSEGCFPMMKDCVAGLVYNASLGQDGNNTMGALSVYLNSKPEFTPTSIYVILTHPQRKSLPRWKSLSVIVKQHLVHIGRIDGDSKYLL